MSDAAMHCPACKARAKTGARFCAQCGKQFGTEKKDERCIQASALVFCGVFASFFLAEFGLALAGLDELDALAYELTSALLVNTCFVLFGLAALRLLGTGSWKESLAGATDGKHLGLALVGGALAFGISFLYVNGVSLLIEPAELEGLAFETPPLWSLLITGALFPAVVEEWLDRGVLWVALSKITTARFTIVASAVLFGMSHGLNGGELLEVPHRFAAGLLFGWLRQRSGSLIPCILAHGTLNTIAILLSV